MDSSFPPDSRSFLFDTSLVLLAACTVCGAMVSTPVLAQAEENSVRTDAKKPLATRPAPAFKPASNAASHIQIQIGAPAKTAALPKISVSKTSGVGSLLSRARVSPIHILQRVLAASRRAESAESETVKSADDATTTPAAPLRLAAAETAQPADAPVIEATAETTATETTTAETTPAQTAPTEAATETETIASDAPLEQNGAPLTATFEMQAPSTPGAAGSTPEVSGTLPASIAAGASRLYAPSISYEGGTVIAAGTPEEPVRFESTAARIVAQNVRLDTIGKTVSAQGKVRVERQVKAQRYSAFGVAGRASETTTETITETLLGENFDYNFETRQGKLGATEVRLANFNISAESLVINGQKYIARNVIVRPGGLSEEDIKIYGTPPLNLRLREFIVDASKPNVSRDDVGDTAKDDGTSAGFSARTSGKGGALYFKNTRLFPVPAALLGRRLGRREEATYQITPRIAFNSADGLLVTTKLFFPFSQTDPDKLTLEADVGLSTKVGFRGGVELQTINSLGKFSIGARLNDVVVSQLTNRIELDRLPEIQYRPPSLPLFQLPGGRTAGLRFGFIAGDYRERFSNGNRVTESSRLQGQVRFTTRMTREDGPYLDLFARAAKYSNHFENLRTAGFEVGYIGPLTSRIAGQFSYSSTGVSGSTPFRFDEVEIRQELRATFDILLTPRYIVPIDLRYDIDRKDLRDATIGILRNYKTFAYGVAYQTSRKELKLEIRQGF